MLIVEIKKLENGARGNQISDFPVIPQEGWIVIPPELEEKAISYLPFIELEIEDGVVVAVSQGEDLSEPQEPPTTEPQPDYMEFLKGIMEVFANE